MGHDAALGILGDSAFLILVLFFAIGGVVVVRMLGQSPRPSEPDSDTEPPRPNP